MNRKIEIAKKKRAEKQAHIESQRLLIEKQVASQNSLKASIDSLYELINGKEEYDFSKLENQLSELDKRLDFAPFFKSLENSITKNKTTQPTKIKIDGFSKLLNAVADNKPMPVKIDLKAFEKSIVNIEQYIKENTKSSDQGAEDYLPYRRVVKMGNRLVFDDNLTNPGGGGGGSSSNGGGNTTVDNFPTEYPLPAAQITTLTPPAAITGFATEAKQDTIIGHVDGIESLLTTIDADTSTIAAKDFATETTLASLNAKDLMLGTDFSAVFGVNTLLTTTQADSRANTTDAFTVNAWGQVFNGTSWDRMRGDATNGLLVNLGANNDVTVTGSLTSAGNVTNAGTFAVQESKTLSTLFDSDGDNTAQQLKGSAGNLYFLEVSNPNSTDAYIQLFDLATGSVTVGTTTPKLSLLVPAGNGTNYGAMDKVFTIPIAFATAITYACTTTATGSTDPTVGLIINAGYI